MLDNLGAASLCCSWGMIVLTVACPKEGQMRSSGQVSRSYKFTYSGQLTIELIIFGSREVPKEARVTRYLAFLWDIHGTRNERVSDCGI
jgi:hypothetical protein